MMLKTIFVDAGGVLFLNKDGMGVLNKGLAEILEKYRKHMKLVLVSDTNYDLQLTLKQNGIENLFNEVVTSGEIGFKKDDTRFYEAVLSQLHVKPEDVLFLDNSQEFLDSAQSLGIQVVLYSTPQAFERALITAKI